MIFLGQGMRGNGLIIGNFWLIIVRILRKMLTEKSNFFNNSVKNVFYAMELVIKQFDVQSNQK